MRLLIKNIGTIVGIQPEGIERLCGEQMERLETLDAARRRTPWRWSIRTPPST